MTSAAIGHPANPVGAYCKRLAHLYTSCLWVSTLVFAPSFILEADRKDSEYSPARCFRFSAVLQNARFDGMIFLLLVVDARMSIHIVSR
jgi:hypothetical protein